MLSKWKRQQRGKSIKTNRFSIMRTERLESRHLLAGDIVVSEFMAQNDGVVLDFDAEDPDWLELHNTSAEAVDLHGWYLTDDALNMTRWQFPVPTVLQPDERVVVFASGRDFVAPNGEPHTNFAISSRGEYLGLVRPDGETIEWQLTERFPRQLPNVSYGISDRRLATPFVSVKSPGAVEVPADDSLRDAWTARDFDDASWTTGPLGIGFAAQLPETETPGFSLRMIDVNGGEDGTLDSALEARAVINGSAPAGDHDITLDVTEVVQQLNVGGSRGSFRDNLPYLEGTVDSSLDDIVLAMSAKVHIPEGDWTIGFGADDGGILSLDGISFIETINEDGTDDLITVGDGELLSNDIRSLSWVRGTFSVGPGGITAPLELIVFNQVGKDSFELAIINEHSTARPRFSNDWTLLSDGVFGWSVTTPALPPIPNLGDLIGTNVEAQMFSQKTSAMVRIPFVVDDPQSFDNLTLRIRYSDGFIAYLNGEEIARANVTGSLNFDSVADHPRTDTEVRTPEEFDVSVHVAKLHAGENVLAIHGFSSARIDAGFLVLPELWAAESLESGLTFLQSPTPGEPNSQGGVAVEAEPEFSHIAGTFTEPFPLEITADNDLATIYYTLDGTIPDEASIPYRAPLSIADTTQLRVRVFQPNYVPSPVVSQTYIRLDDDVREFTSDLPIIVIENYDQGIPDRPWQNGFAAVFEPDATGRSSLDNFAHMTSRIGLHRRGSSTFVHPKTNYRIEFRDENENDKAVQLLNMPEEADWVFFAPWLYDRTLVRNSFLYELSNQLEFYSPRTRFIELFADTDGNGLTSSDYMGVYVVMEKIKRDPNRVDVQEVRASDLTEPDITGGYIFKNDRGEEPNIWKSDRGLPSIEWYVHVEPKDEELSPAQKNYLRGYVDQFEAALYGPDFKDPDVGYEAFIDVDSFIDQHWLRALTNDPDGLRLSQYWIKDRGGKLEAGPLWDFDRTMGNDGDSRSNNPRRFDPQSVNYLTYDWWGRLFEDPDFTQRWIDRYQEFRIHGDFSGNKFATIIDSLTAQLEEAQQRNFDRWPLTAPEGGDEFAQPGLEGWKAEISHLKGWLRERIAWIDTQFLPPPTVSESGGVVEPTFEFTFGANGNPIYYTLDGTDPRGEDGVIRPEAILFDDQPVVVNDTTQLIARVFDADGSNLKTWSSPTDVAFLILSEGDFTGDGFVDADDIDRLFAETMAAEPDAQFDLNADQAVNGDDVQTLLMEILDTRFGDVDLNGVVDFADFEVFAANFGGTDKSWADGDFDGNRNVDFRDFNVLSNNFGLDRLA